MYYLCILSSVFSTALYKFTDITACKCFSYKKNLFINSFNKLNVRTHPLTIPDTHVDSFVNINRYQLTSTFSDLHRKPLICVDFLTCFQSVFTFNR